MVIGLRGRQLFLSRSRGNTLRSWTPLLPASYCPRVARNTKMISLPEPWFTGTGESPRAESLNKVGRRKDRTALGLPLVGSMVLVVTNTAVRGGLQTE